MRLIPDIGPIGGTEDDVREWFEQVRADQARLVENATCTGCGAVAVPVQMPGEQTPRLLDITTVGALCDVFGWEFDSVVGAIESVKEGAEYRSCRMLKKDGSLCGNGWTGDWPWPICRQHLRSMLVSFGSAIVFDGFKDGGAELAELAKDALDRLETDFPDRYRGVLNERAAAAYEDRLSRVWGA